MKETANPNNSSTKIILIILIVVLAVCFLVTCISIFVFRGFFNNLINPTITPTIELLATPVSPTELPVSTINGDWLGSYTIESPGGCAGYSGSWDATLYENKGVLSGTYSSDAGLSGNVTGTVSGSNVNWSVSGGGGVSFTGSISNGSISGNFTGPVCEIGGSNSHTSGTFTGSKRLN